MEKLLQKIDLLGENFSLRFGKEKKLKTTCGGCVTIAATVWLTTTFIFFIGQLFDSTELELSNAEQFTDIPPKIELYRNMIIPVVGASAGVLVKKADITKIYTYKLSFFTMGDDNSTSTSVTFNKKTYDFIDCDLYEERGWIY